MYVSYTHKDGGRTEFRRTKLRQPIPSAQNPESLNRKNKTLKILNCHIFSENVTLSLTACVKGNCSKLDITNKVTVTRSYLVKKGYILLISFLASVYYNNCHLSTINHKILRKRLSKKITRQAARQLPSEGLWMTINST